MIAPEPDRESAAFWDGLRRHRLVLQTCDGCRRPRFPPMPGCPFCGSTDRREIEVDGAGRLYSWVAVRRALSPGMAGETPYRIGVVELDAGPRVLARLDDDASGGIGDRLVPFYVDHQGWSELRYRLPAP